MLKRYIFTQLLILSQLLSGQEKALELFLADSSLANVSVSVCILNTSNDETVFEYNAEKSLIPASVLKLVTTSAALELLGPEYRFTTKIGFSGNLNKRTGNLTGNIVIKGGGDPSLGSVNFSDYYNDFLSDWITRIKNLGIRKIDGRVITDDSRFDYQPVPAKWLWEDAGNYYGAGVYGLSVFDNTIEIHFLTYGDGSIPVIKGFVPVISRFELSNQLIALGNSDKGYVFRAPYSDYAWLAGTIPVNREDFVLKASVCDPPYLFAKIIDKMLDSMGVVITKDPSTTRIESDYTFEKVTSISEVASPPLKEIIEVLNHESVNLYAEHLLKELGFAYKNEGTTAAGIDVLYKFMRDAGINCGGIFLEDGSGLSPLNALTARGLTEILLYMRKEGKYGKEFYYSLPEAGIDGTLKSYFRDPVFENNLRAKSGSMTRVRSYAGYFSTKSGNELAFTILVNNYSGPSQKVVKGIEEILKEAILFK
jgi:serine-type D-Ala-D-Ala carboxypeptidase/endopeptidase (penicillin-binding protein 4)